MKYTMNAKSSFLEVNDFAEDMATELLRIKSLFAEGVTVKGYWKACSAAAVISEGASSTYSCIYLSSYM